MEVRAGELSVLEVEIKIAYLVNLSTTMRISV